MEALIIISVSLVVLIFTALAFYTSIGQGADKTIEWITKQIIKDRKGH